MPGLTRQLAPEVEVVLRFSVDSNRRRREQQREYRQQDMKRRPEERHGADAARAAARPFTKAVH